jgi:ribonuclease HI
MTARLEVYCDGSGGGRVDRPGGWAFVIVRAGEVLLEGAGGAARTTALTMELEAARAGLAAVLELRGRPPGVTLISDSRVTLEVVSGARELKAERYVLLARRLRSLAVMLETDTQWVRGHAGNRWNERADALALRAKQEQPGRASKPRTNQQPNE